jgi:hypothetical protein
MTDEKVETKNRRQYKVTETTNLALELNSGDYYLLAKVGGKGYRISLKTKDLATAKMRLETRMAQLRRGAVNANNLRAEARFSDKVMWRLFILKTAPQILKQLMRLNNNLERKL